MYRVCQHLAHIVDQTCPENNLKLISCYKHTFHQVHVLNRLCVCFIVVFQHQPEAGSTVGHT